MQQPVSGSCLCGQVRYQVNGGIKVFQYCHCSRCRKFSGSAHAANILLAPAQFEWLAGEALLGRYEPAETRHFATSFCRNCGSSMPWLAKSGQVVVVPAGSLDQDPQIQPSQNIHYDSRAPWYRSVAELPKYDRLPPRKG